MRAGARTAWHTHLPGQTLIVTSGFDWVQRERGPKSHPSDGSGFRTACALGME